MNSDLPVDYGRDWLTWLGYLAGHGTILGIIGLIAWRRS